MSDSVVKKKRFASNLRWLKIYFILVISLAKNTNVLEDTKFTFSVAIPMICPILILENGYVFVFIMRHRSLGLISGIRISKRRTVLVHYSYCMIFCYIYWCSQYLAYSKCCKCMHMILTSRFSTYHIFLHRQKLYQVYF